MTKDTRDEFYYWSSKRKEQRMKEILGQMQEKMRRNYGKETSKEKTGSKKIQVVSPFVVVPEKATPKSRPFPGQTKMSDFL